jgi:hypothetical protein
MKSTATAILAAISLALMLGGCAGPSASPTTNTAALQQKVLAAEVAYEAPLALAVAYNKRPRCTVPPTIVLCSEPVVVEQLRKANHAVMTAFGAAMNVASTPGVSESAVVAAIAVATDAIGPLQTILSAYK